jgi:hypothetical protein
MYHGFRLYPGRVDPLANWCKRFDDGVHEYVRIAAHFVVKEVHDRDFSTPCVRSNSPLSHSYSPMDHLSVACANNPIANSSSPRIVRTRDAIMGSAPQTVFMPATKK